MHGCDEYYDAAAILAEDTLVPVIFNRGATGLGKMLDQSCVGDDLQPGARVDLPMWMATALAQREIVQMRTPKFYGLKLQRKMIAGAQCEDLRARCAYFYDVACLLHDITRSDDLCTFVNNTFRARYKELLTKAHSTSMHETTRLQSLMSAEELALFEAGRQSIDAYDRWRGTRSSANPALASKRRCTRPQPTGSGQASRR